MPSFETLLKFVMDWAPFLSIETIGDSIKEMGATNEQRAKLNRFICENVPSHSDNKYERFLGVPAPSFRC